MSVCKNCTREISEAEITKYFEGEGYEDLEEQMNPEQDEPDYDYEPGEKTVTLWLKNMKCPNCKNKLNNCTPFETKVDIEEQWFDDYSYDYPDQSSSFCAFSRYTIIQEDIYPFVCKNCTR